MKQPNLFIIGAPKCGTTSLATWLDAHPNVFMCARKEPNYFANDFNLPWQRNRSRYENLFRGAGPGHHVVGEATPFYLRSRVAVAEILQYAPDARFVVGIRNPAEMVISWHRHLVNEAWESETSVERAWHMQDERRAGRGLPRLCPYPEFLMYASYCRLGEQLTRLLAQVPREHVFIYTLDQLHLDPRAVWLDLLNFLDLPDDGSDRFPVLNRARTIPRWVALTVRLANAGKMKLGVYGLGLGVLKHLQEKTAQGPIEGVSTRFRNELVGYYSDDIRALNRLTGWDCSPWLEQSLPLESDRSYTRGQVAASAGG